MNKIEQLIQQLCPKGVKWKELGEVCVNIASGKNKTRIKDGDFPVFGSTGIIGYSDSFEYDDSLLLVARVGANAGYVHIAEGKCNISDNTLLIKPKSDYNLRFAYFQLLSLNLNQFAVGGGQPLITAGLLKKLFIPIPPLPIQQEIVTILDKFTSLEAELEAELEARTRQYDFYRNHLLSFDNSNVEWKTLEEVCEKTVNIKWKENTDVEYQYIDLSSVDRGTNTILETQIINSDNAPSRAQQIVQNEDVIFGTTRPTLRRYCFIKSEYDGQICSTGFCVLRANKNIIMPQYLFFVLTTSDFYNYVENNQEGAGYPAISNSKVKKYKIPIPPLSEQARIVAILDKFDKLVNDISEGLPAEIKVRRKQYEYYREKLLTFNNVNN